MCAITPLASFIPLRSLVSSEYNKELTKNLIERHNSIVSYNIENKFAEEESIEEQDEVDIKSIVDFVKNKNKWKEKHS